jgi:hypothetical protein
MREAPASAFLGATRGDRRPGASRHGILAEESRLFTREILHAEHSEHALRARGG